MSNQTPKVSKLVRTAPERIFLQIADDDYSGESFPRPYGEEITWCETSCVSCEVEYVRADSAVEQRAALLEALRKIANYADGVGTPVRNSVKKSAIARAAIALAQGDAA